ncbi:MAG: LPS assembly lipoprotein LptE [Gemmatimonadetes bacterium]|nr:LPS assembly lipoprotein LptE [Gemmatimonadota bacterium]
MRFRPASGRCAIADLTVALATALTLAGCYSFSGGGGLPNDVRTIYIAPFENRTAQFDLEQQVFRRLTEALPRALGLRAAGEQNADAIVRGRIVRYDDAAQSYRPGQQGNVQDVQHQVTIVVAIEFIHVRENLILWESQGVTGRGEYRPDSQSDEVARTRALDALVQQIIDGAQSQW